MMVTAPVVLLTVATAVLLDEYSIAKLFFALLVLSVVYAANAGTTSVVLCVSAVVEKFCIVWSRLIPLPLT